MKTTIIKVDPSDDIQSIRDRIAWSNSPRILLILPRNKKGFPDDKGFALLNRAAAAKGAQLGMVTGQTNHREFARKIGVSVFRSVAQAESQAWLVPPQTIYDPQRSSAESIIEIRKSVPAESTGVSILQIPKSALVIVCTAILLIAFLVFVPSATVVVYPKTLTQEHVIEIHAVTNAVQNSVSGVIPAQKITFTLTGAKSAQSNGSAAVGKTRASGEVVATNLTNQAIELPEGTVFSTAPPDQQKFTSTQAVVIPARGSAVTIPVKAALAGEAGNVEAGEIVLIEGLAGSSLRVTNDAPTTGGTSDLLPAPSEEDYERLTAQLLDELKGNALEESMLDSAFERKPILESLVLDEIVSEDRGNPAGEAADTLSISITARYSVLYYDPTTLEDLMVAVMDISMPDGYQAAEAGMTVDRIGRTEINGTDEAVWKVSVKRQVVKIYSPQDVRKLIRGRGVERAVDLVNREIPQIQSAEIRPFISWWPYLPVLLEQIDFEERLSDGG